MNYNFSRPTGQLCSILFAYLGYLNTRSLEKYRHFQLCGEYFTTYFETERCVMTCQETLLIFPLEKKMSLCVYHGKSIPIFAPWQNTSRCPPVVSLCFENVQWRSHVVSHSIFFEIFFGNINAFKQQQKTCAQ